MGGTYTPGPATNTSSFLGSTLNGMGTTVIAPPSGVTVAANTTTNCGSWYVVQAGDDCGFITANNAIVLSLFADANPSINSTNCDASLQVGQAYCVAPVIPTSFAPSYQWQPLGCWNNTDPYTAVLVDSFFNDTAAMTVEECATTCIDEDYPFFGLSGSSTCVCGFEVAINSVQLASGLCSQACAGNSTEVCGGANGATSLFGISGLPIAFQYSDLGCFADSSSSRALLGSRSLLGQGNTTVDTCASYCLPAYPYFGLENGSDCWCGTMLNSAVAQLNETMCNTNCTGSDFDTCGGSSAMEVFAITTAPAVIYTTPAYTTPTGSGFTPIGTPSTQPQPQPQPRAKLDFRGFFVSLLLSCCCCCRVFGSM